MLPGAGLPAGQPAAMIPCFARPTGYLDAHLTFCIAPAVAHLLLDLLWAANPKVELTTSLGKIELELYPEKAPKSVENFLRYVNDGHYNGTVFHRIISGFMVQGGGFDKAMVERSTRAPIANEANK